MPSILDELKQSQPFPSTGLEASVSLLRTSMQLRRLLEQEMADYGVTLQQFNVLRILRGAGGPVPTMEIANRMVEPEPGITRLLGRIEAKGLISRERCENDGRRVLACITPEGEELLRTMGEPTDFLGAPADAMTQEELDQFVLLLGKARKALENA